MGFYCGLMMCVAFLGTGGNMGIRDWVVKGVMVSIPCPVMRS